MTKFVMLPIFVIYYRRVNLTEHRGGTMSLHPVITKLEDVDESLREHYKQVGDHYELDFPAESIKLHTATKPLENAFRETSEELKSAKSAAKELARLKALSGDTSLEELVNARQKKADEPDKIDEVRQQYEKMMADLKTQVESERAEAEKIRQDLVSQQIQNELNHAFSHPDAPKLRPGGHRYLTDEAMKSQLFRLQDGRAVWYEGEIPVPDPKNGHAGPLQWLQSIRDNSDYALFFEQGGGGGSNRGQSNPTGGVETDADARAVIANI